MFWASRKLMQVVRIRDTLRRHDNTQTNRGREQSGCVVHR